MTEHVTTVKQINTANRWRWVCSCTAESKETWGSEAQAAAAAWLHRMARASAAGP